MALNAFTTVAAVEAAVSLQKVRGTFTFTNAADYATGGFAATDWVMAQLGRPVVLFNITGDEVGGKRLVFNKANDKVMVFDKDGQIAALTNLNGLTFFATIEFE